jgi:hypothetical protein
MIGCTTGNNPASQSPSSAALQQRTGEIWGSYNRDLMGGRSPFPSVDAYVGPLPVGEKGDRRAAGQEYAPTAGTLDRPRDGVIVEGDYAKIKVKVTRNTQEGTP